MSTSKEKKKKRNHYSDEVRVDSLADHKDGTLYKRSNDMAQNRYEVFIHNVDYILSKKGISQAHMCEHNLEGLLRSQQLSTYRDTTRDIPFITIVRMALAFGYTPEQMIGQLLDQTEHSHQHLQSSHRPDDEYKKYVGAYHMAYFSTDAKYGDNKRSTARDLAFGILSVYEGNAVEGIPTLKAIALTNCTHEDQRRIATLHQSEGSNIQEKKILECYHDIVNSKQDNNKNNPSTKYLYTGELTLTERITEISLHQIVGTDVIHISLHNRAANSSAGSKYRGGLGTMLSTSRGIEHMPCVQSIILSKRCFEDISHEELAKHLLLMPPQVNMHSEASDIITYTRALYPSDSNNTPLSILPESDKLFMLENYIEKKLTGVIMRNLLRYYKVSVAEDSNVYKAICR